MMSEPLVVLGQIVGASFAAGLNLYATVALLGVASRLGWIPDLPPTLQGLENGLVIASASGLYLVEFVVDKVRHVDSLWDTIHTFIRPSAAALLSFAALAAAPLPWQLAGGLLGGAIALAAHGGKAGLRLALNASPDPVSRALISTAEDVLALGFVVGALRYPAAALAGFGAGAVVGVRFGPRLWRAFLLGFRALAARVRRVFDRARWREAAELPRDLRALLGPPPLGRAPPRAARVAVKDLRGVGAYRNGWLVITPDSRVFLYRSRFRPRRLELPLGRSGSVRHGLWADALELETDHARFTMFLLKDGPPAEAAISELSLSGLATPALESAPA
ncbi:MAG: DUF4126 domain-containing protein [Gemmatimonadetes bacterium]|nr:DUF4126 domain-containing protein [Gemmatimonadota bacterium]